jgi:hypothetical protein
MIHRPWKCKLTSRGRRKQKDKMALASHPKGIIFQSAFESRFRSASAFTPATKRIQCIAIEARPRFFSSAHRSRKIVTVLYPKIHRKISSATGYTSSASASFAFPGHRQPRPLAHHHHHMEPLIHPSSQHLHSQ